MSQTPGFVTTRNRGLLCFLALLIGVAGFLLGRFSAPSTTAAVEAPAPSATASGLTALPPAGPALAPVQVGTSGWREDSWRRLHSQPGTAERNKALSAMLEQLAASDPKQAMATALAEKNLQLRDTLIQAVLRGWATTEPEGAARWARALPSESDRYAAINSVFTGACAHPDEAIRVVTVLAKENIGDATEYATSLIRSLTEAGDFQNAVKLAASTNEGFRGIWMAEAYSRWAVMQPDSAAQAALLIGDPALRAEALHGVVSGWSEADPAALTQFISALPKGTPDSTKMLGQALQAWAKVDQEAVLQWVGQNDLGAEADDGIAAVASAGFLKPQEAANWAAGITDVQLRSSTMLSVLRNWWGADPEGAQQYFARATGLLPEDRKQAEEMLMLSGAPR